MELKKNDQIICIDHYDKLIVCTNDCLPRIIFSIDKVGILVDGTFVSGSVPSESF